jgi:hypothetical protein
MREGEPSRTAFGAAVLRALHPELDRPVVSAIRSRSLGLPPSAAPGGAHVIRAHRTG